MHVLIIVGISIYYQMILVWSLLYLFDSFSITLPWSIENPFLPEEIKKLDLLERTSYHYHHGILGLSKDLPKGELGGFH